MSEDVLTLKGTTHQKHLFKLLGNPSVFSMGQCIWPAVLVHLVYVHTFHIIIASTTKMSNDLPVKLF